VRARVVVEDGGVVAAEGPDGDVPWWSFTKTAIAAAALALVRDGRLQLDSPLAGKPYTLRQLLQHRAGVTNYGRLVAYHEAVARGDDAWPVEELLARTNADRLIFPPGTGWAYSNIGYLHVCRLIEETTGEPLDLALRRLALGPLGIDNTRLAMRREDLSSVNMGVIRTYDPRWVYHGLLIGPLSDATLLLHRVMTGPLLPPDLVSAMLDRHAVHDDGLAGRPWTLPGYGLGLMTGGIIGDRFMAGHTGGGPGSVIAVYHLLERQPPRTVAAFSIGDDQGRVEHRCVEES
jgi:CubicO group peptidase (beta-lactamase class C family)